MRGRRFLYGVDPRAPSSLPLFIIVYPPPPVARCASLHARRRSMDMAGSGGSAQHSAGTGARAGWLALLKPTLHIYVRSVTAAVTGSRAARRPGVRSRPCLVRARDPRRAVSWLFPPSFARVRDGASHGPLTAQIIFFPFTARVLPVNFCFLVVLDPAARDLPRTRYLSQPSVPRRDTALAVVERPSLQPAYT